MGVHVQQNTQVLQEYIQSRIDDQNQERALNRLVMLLPDAVPDRLGDEQERVRVLLSLAELNSFDIYIKSNGGDILALSLSYNKLINDGFEPNKVILAIHDWCNAIGLNETMGYRYQDNNDGTVTDHLTNLMWQRCSIGQHCSESNCTGLPTKYTWHEACDVESNVGGYDDWRIPDEDELKSLIYCYEGYIQFGFMGCNHGHSTDTAVIYSEAFPNTDKEDKYWTSSKVRSDIWEVRTVSFKQGMAWNDSEKCGRNYLRLVRNV